jgi:hypothetical protein
MKNDLPVNYEKLFFYLKFNPFLMKEQRYYKNRKICFTNEEQYQITKHMLKWADNLLPLMIQRSHITMLLLKDKIKQSETKEKTVGLNAWL